MLTLFNGWSERPFSACVDSGRGRSLLEPKGFEPVPDVGIVCTLQQGMAGTMVLTAVCPEVSLKKTVYADGRTALEFDQGSDRLTLVTSDHEVTAVRGHRTASASLYITPEMSLTRLRQLLVASGAVRSFRLLAAAIEEIDEDTPEHAGVRLAGVLVAHFDGDVGAIPRLSRELGTRYGRRRRAGRPPVSGAEVAYRKVVRRASGHMDADLATYSFWHPARQTSALTWLLHVEMAWHALASATVAARAKPAPYPPALTHPRTP